MPMPSRGPLACAAINAASSQDPVRLQPSQKARRHGWHRPQISATALNLLMALFIMAMDNHTFWQRGAAIFDGTPFRLALFGAVVWALTLFLVTFFGFRWLQKPVLVFVLMLSAVTSYYMDTLGVMIDRDMIQNVVTTTFAESRHLITPHFLGHVVLYGLLPSILVIWVRLRPRPFFRNLAGWALMSVASFALFAGLMLSDFKTFSAVLRERKDLIGSYQPGAPLGGAFRYGKMMLKSREVIVAAPYGLDARKGPLLAAAPKPVLTVLVVGETARAQNFSLNGYPRDTNPELAARNIVNFPHVSSCGTATAVSMPCMFSHLGRDDYSYEKGLASENLLDVLGHAGVKVEWWDNNTGDKDIAARFPSRNLGGTVNADFCGSGECTDAIFLPLLEKAVAEMTEDTVLVLHQIGSHGPAYHLRYPPDFSRFVPACNTAEFADCTIPEIVNAYDNSILYTDHILAQTIDMLAAQDKVIPALLYVSDHGESLGEDGLYLHGAPYFMAPETQTRVPMLLWLSDAWTQTFGLNPACLKTAAQAEISHDNLFSSVLGMMDIQTQAREDDLDLFSTCHQIAS